MFRGGEKFPLPQRNKNKLRFYNIVGLNNITSIIQSIHV